MTTKANIDAWVRYVYMEWHKNNKSSVLPSSIKIVLRKMEEALNVQDRDDAWHNLERMSYLSGGRGDKGASGTSQSQIYAEARLECGVGAYWMDDFRQAKTFFDEAYASYTSDRHYRAVMRWLIGCVQWILPSQMDEAIISWEECIKTFEQLAGSSGSNSAWYHARVKELRRVVDLAVEKNDPPPPPPLGSGSRTPPIAGHLSSLQMVGEIPAGTPAGALPLTNDYLEFETAFLENVPHRIFSLYTGQNLVRILKHQDYFVLKVRGHSMNDAKPVPIDNGDSVVIRAQNVPDKSGDIVAAEIYNFDNRVTLKRLSMDREKGKFILYPESTHPDFQGPIYLSGQSFNKVGEGWRIWGIAIAVLKRVEE